MAALTNDTRQVGSTNGYYGLGGDDTFNIKYLGSSFSPFLPLASGGQGDDRYAIDLLDASFSNSFVSINENGYSSNDVLTLTPNYFAEARGSAVEIGSHLFFGTYDAATNVSEGILIFDWTERGHEIETYDIGGVIYSHGEFVNVIRDWDKHSTRSGDTALDASRDQADSTASSRFIAQINADFNGIDNAIFRFYNASNGTHFYTASTEERDAVIQNSGALTYEGASFGFVDSGGDLDVFRFFNEATGTHFYTASTEERDFISENLDHFTLEGVAYRASSIDNAATTALHRFYNTETGSHFYTSSAEEQAWVEATLPQFTYEGVAYYMDTI